MSVRYRAAASVLPILIVLATTLMPSTSRASDWPLLPDSFADGWSALQQEFPGVQIKFRWGRVHAIYGKPFGGGETPLDSAENFISEFGADLFGIGAASELVLGRVTWPAEGDGPAYVRYHQEYGGKRLVGAHLSLTIANREGHPVTLVSGFIHPTPNSHLRSRNRTRQQAIDIAEDLFGEREVSVDRVTEVIWPTSKQPEYAWEMRVVPADNADDRERVTIGTFAGRVLRRTPLVQHFTDYTATVLGEKSNEEEVPVECDTGTDNEFPLEWVTVRVVETPPCGGACYDESDITDVSGEADFMDVPASFTVTATLENEWFVVYDDRIQSGCGSPPCCQARPSTCDPRQESDDETEDTLHFTDSTQTRSVQLVTGWRWLNEARYWVDDLDSTFELGEKLELRGNILGQCSPGYEPYEEGEGEEEDLPPRIRLTNRNADVPADCPEGGNGGFCECKPCIENEPNPDEFFFLKDLHLSTIAVHEYGHHLQYQEHAGSTSSPWNENMPDAFAAFVTDEPVIGKEICEEELGGACEDSDATRSVATPDLVWPSFDTSKYPNGRPMANAYWDMRDELGDDDHAGAILLHSIKKQPVGIDPTIALHAVQVDDDSGVNSSPSADDDLSNGSPNYETINAAFRLHGLATDNVDYVDIDWTSGTPGDVADTADLTIAVDVDAGSLTLASTDPVKLRWRVNSGSGGGGSWTEVAMNYGPPATYSYTIDDANYSVGDVIDFYVRAEVTDADKQYTSFPTQGQHDWTTPNSDDIPEERDFASVLVTNSAKEVALSTDLQSDPSWTVGTDEWEWGAPDLAEFGEQPGNDYPFDDDGVTPSPNCYFTSNEDSVDDDWALTTSTFDLSQTGVDYAVVSYALWFFSRQSEVTEEKFEVDLYGDDSTWYMIQTIDVEESGGPDADTKRVRWIRQRLTVPNGSGQGQVPFGSSMKLRFRAVVDGAGGVEAVVDEVRVWGVYE